VADDVTVSTVVPPAVTLALGWVVALGLYATAGDAPSEFLTDRVVPSALILAALAAPVALLFAWGELDLSAFGMLPFAGYVYAEVGGDTVVVGLLAAAAAGLAIGAAIGLLRWLTRVPSAVLSLAVGFVLQAVMLKQLDSGNVHAVEDGWVDGSGLPALVAIGFTSLTVAAAVAFRRPAGVEVGTAAGPRGGEVVVGFALSGAAAGAAGALNAGIVRAVVPTGQVVLLTVLAAVAIGGVVRGNRLVGPLAAAVAAGAAQLLADSAVLRAWQSGDRQLLVASVLGVCLLVSHGLHRLIGYRPGVPPAGAAPPAAWGPPMGDPAAAPWPAVGAPPAAPPPAAPPPAAPPPPPA
jgi:ribose/xylose/arabinose/galactoside ABC-type transport system permease subunit